MSELELFPRPEEPGGALEISAQTILARLCEEMGDLGVPIPRRARGILGKQAKELLEDGYEPEIVYAAAEMALRRGGAHLTSHIALDMALVRAQLHVSTNQYFDAMKRAKAALDPEHQAMQDRIRRAMS